MEHTGKFTALTTLTLASLLVLGACGSGNAQSRTSSASVAIAKTTRSSSASSSPSATRSASTQGTSTESLAEVSDQSSVASSTSAPQASLLELSEATETRQTPPTTPEVLNQATNQSTPSDFAYLAGTWANDEGKVLTVNADGTISDGAKIESDGSGALGVRTKEGAGAALFYAPAGQEFPESIAPKEYTAGTDITKERLVIAQSVGEMAHPFYRIAQ